MQFYLFNIRPKLTKITRQTVLNFLKFTSSPLMLLFVQP